MGKLKVISFNPVCKTIRDEFTLHNALGSFFE